MQEKSAMIDCHWVFILQERGVERTSKFRQWNRCSNFEFEPILAFRLDRDSGCFDQRN